MIEDLSYSGLVELIQGNVGEGRLAIIELSERYISAKNEIALADKKLKLLKQDADQIYGGIEKILKHLSITLPLAVKVDKGIIVITNNGITVETNVI